MSKNDSAGTSEDVPLAEVISLEAKARETEDYNAAVQKALVTIDECTWRLLEEAVSIAMVGPWKDWSEAQPVGVVLHIDDEKLMETGDKYIVELIGLVRQARAAFERLGIDLEE